MAKPTVQVEVPKPSGGGFGGGLLLLGGFVVVLIVGLSLLSGCQTPWEAAADAKVQKAQVEAQARIQAQESAQQYRLDKAAQQHQQVMDTYPVIFIAAGAAILAIFVFLAGLMVYNHLEKQRHQQEYALLLIAAAQAGDRELLRALARQSEFTSALLGAGTVRLLEGNRSRSTGHGQ